MRTQKTRTVRVGTPESKTSEANTVEGEEDTQTTLRIHPQNDLGEPSLRYNWQSPIVLSRHNQDVVYFGSNKFHRSLRKGAKMETMSIDLTTNPTQGDVPFGTLTTISESPLKFGLIYVGTDDGSIHITKDGGYSFTNLTKNLPKALRGFYVSRVTSSKFKESRVYVTLNGYRNDHFNSYVFVSEDYGNTFTQICKDLPLEPVNVIVEDNLQEEIIYVGTDGGLYVSLDGGKTSMHWNAGMPKSVPVHDLVVHPRDNEIVVGTHGRSLYIASLNKIQQLVTNPAYRDKVIKSLVGFKEANNEEKE
jgi:hypothetical protein